jgi:hypothetical protein
MIHRKPQTHVSTTFTYLQQHNILLIPPPIPLNLTYSHFHTPVFFFSHRKHPPRSPTQRVPPERDGNYDKPAQEETLMSTVWN